MTEIDLATGFFDALVLFSCGVLGLALALLVSWVALADHHDTTVATNHTAVITDRFHAGINLHDGSLLAVLVLAGCRKPLLFSSYL